MKKLTLPARIAQDEDAYLATVDNLELMGRGATVKDAQDDLVGKFLSWLQACDGQGTLEADLSKAGYTGANEHTELELQFLE